jgi:hypothetical protein
LCVLPNFISDFSYCTNPSGLIGLFALYGLGPFHLGSQLAEKLLHPLGHLLGVYLANMIGILTWVLAEGHSQVEVVVAKQR